jgi:hypothetical protein
MRGWDSASIAYPLFVSSPLTLAVLSFLAKTERERDAKCRYTDKTRLLGILGDLTFHAPAFSNGEELAPA